MSYCGVCGVPYDNRPHTFNVCNTNLRDLLRRYREHVVAYHGSEDHSLGVLPTDLDYLDIEYEQEDAVDPVEAAFIRGLTP